MSTLERHGTHAAGRLELDLAAWLAEFEPAATPIALRLRTYADLRDLATQRQPRLAWLKPALSLAGSVAAIGGTAFALMALVVLSAAVDRSGFSGIGSQPEPTEPAPAGSYALISLIVAAVGVLAGASLYLGYLRRSFVRVVFGASKATPAALLPLRRPWRSIGLPGLALALLTVATAIAAWLAFLEDLPIVGLDLVSPWLVAELAMAPLVLVIVWRYPLEDRSTRLLLAGAVVFLVHLWAGFAWRWIRFFPPLLDYDAVVLLILYLLPMTAAVVLVAGLAARLDLRVGPRTAVAAFFVALGFMQTRFGPVPAGGETQPLLSQLLWVVEGLNYWLIFLAWLAAAWIGFAGLRRTRSRAWLIVLAAGVIGASGYAGVYVTSTGVFFDLGPYTEAWLHVYALSSTWYSLATALAQVGLLVALAVGLRPVVARPAPADAPAGTAPAGTAPAGTAPPDPSGS
jgi:hypothetical protein